MFVIIIIVVWMSLIVAVVLVDVFRTITFHHWSRHHFLIQMIEFVDELM